MVLETAAKAGSRGRWVQLEHLHHGKQEVEDEAVIVIAIVADTAHQLVALHHGHLEETVRATTTAVVVVVVVAAAMVNNPVATVVAVEEEGVEAHPGSSRTAINNRSNNSRATAGTVEDTEMETATDRTINHPTHQEVKEVLLRGSSLAMELRGVHHHHLLHLRTMLLRHHHHHL